MQVELSVTLKQCPFCQEEDRLEFSESKEYNEIDGKYFWYVFCRQCGAHGPYNDDRLKAVTGWQKGVPRNTIPFS